MKQDRMFWHCLLTACTSARETLYVPVSHIFLRANKLHLFLSFYPIILAAHTRCVYIYLQGA